MRTIKELELAALALRAKLRDEGKDPLEGVFYVTAEEHAFMKMKMQPLQAVTLNHEHDRFCGLKVHIV